MGECGELLAKTCLAYAKRTQTKWQGFSMNHYLIFDSGTQLHCPFCGQLVIPNMNDPEGELDPCEHTHFIAHSEGLEHLSLAMEDALTDAGYEVNGLEITRTNEPEDGDQRDALDAVELPNSLVITRTNAGEHFSVDVCFAPSPN